MIGRRQPLQPCNAASFICHKVIRTGRRGTRAPQIPGRRVPHTYTKVLWEDTPIDWMTIQCCGPRFTIPVARFADGLPGARWTSGGLAISRQLALSRLIERQTSYMKRIAVIIGLVLASSMGV